MITLPHQFLSPQHAIPFSMVPNHLTVEEYGVRLDSVLDFADNQGKKAKDVAKHFNWFVFPIHLDIIDYKLRS
jgi:hypothetical protein